MTINEEIFETPLQPIKQFCFGHGGKREGAGRKKLPDSKKKQAAVVRVPVELLPVIEQLKRYHGKADISIEIRNPSA